MPQRRAPTFNFTTVPLVLFLLQLVRAQHNAPLGPPPVTATSTTTPSGSAPSAVSLSPAALSSDAAPFAAIPTFTDLASPTMDPDDAPANHSVFDFYFFFLALFIIAIAVLYWVLRRKRRRLFANARRRQQDALAADLERWPGNGRERRVWRNEPRTGRWYGLRPVRAQEGLNERGEAPPAYVAKPDPTHSPVGPASTRPEWIEVSGKPPNYDGMRRT